MYNMILKRMQMKNSNKIICEYDSKELKIHLSRKKYRTEAELFIFPLQVPIYVRVYMLSQ